MSQEAEPTKAELRKVRWQFAGMLLIMAGCNIVLAFLALLSMSKTVKHWREMIEFEASILPELPTEEEVKITFDEES